MTRFLRPLANRVLVVSEPCGSARERAEWGDAIVFAAPDELAASCRWFLDHPDERRLRAEHAATLLRRRAAADALREPVQQLVRDTCPTVHLRTNRSAARPVVHVS